MRKLLKNSQMVSTRYTMYGKSDESKTNKCVYYAAARAMKYSHSYPLHMQYRILCSICSGPPITLVDQLLVSRWRAGTGKSLSEALIFASTNPQYDNKLFIVHENCKLRIPAEHVVYTNCCFVLTFRTILVHNMFSRSWELLKKIYLHGPQESLAGFQKLFLL